MIKQLCISLFIGTYVFSLFKNVHSCLHNQFLLIHTYKHTQIPIYTFIIKHNRKTKFNNKRTKTKKKIVHTSETLVLRCLTMKSRSDYLDSYLLLFRLAMCQTFNFTFIVYFDSLEPSDLVCKFSFPFS